MREEATETYAVVIDGLKNAMTRVDFRKIARISESVMTLTASKTMGRPLNLLRGFLTQSKID